MELKITSDRDNELLSRREITAHASYADKTPAKAEVKEELCKKLNLDPNLVEIREIRQQYGLRASDITAYSYHSKEAMDKLSKKRGAKGAKPKATSGATASA
jgi:ribosomal protein S24E